eukprot:2203194-Rhodomonas_salina.1
MAERARGVERESSERRADRHGREPRRQGCRAPLIPAQQAHLPGTLPPLHASYPPPSYALSGTELARAPHRLRCSYALAGTEQGEAGSGRRVLEAGVAVGGLRPPEQVPAPHPPPRLLACPVLSEGCGGTGRWDKYTIHGGEVNQNGQDRHWTVDGLPQPSLPCPPDADVYSTAGEQNRQAGPRERLSCRLGRSRSRSAGRQRAGEAAL